MDKLINYDNLDTFRENLVKDSDVSTLATWSSSKISALIAALDARITALEPQPANAE